MTTTNPDTTTARLVELNTEIGDMEQKGGPEALKFFETHLSDQLVFRRANGKVVGKSGTGGFLDTLNSSPFAARQAEGIAVTLLGSRALVTLVVVATRPDGSVARYRNIRLFSESNGTWIVEFWYNYELTFL